MIRAVIFDVDGVVIKKREMYFTERLAREHGLSYKPIAAFVSKDLPRCFIGRADTKVVLKKYLKPWGWRSSVASLMRYWFSHEATTSPGVLQSVAKLRRRGIKCYLATDNEKYRTAYLWKAIGLRKHFDGVFASCGIGAFKSSPRFWRAVRRRLLPIVAASVVVWDDSQENIRAARTAGFQARLYRSFTAYRKSMKAV